MSLLGNSVISEFKGEAGFLSNFYHSPFTVDGILFSTVEHFYQASKCMGSDNASLFIEIIAANSPGKAKRLGRSVDLSKQFLRKWEAGLKIKIMKYALMRKFSIPEFKKLLLSTGGVYLQEGNSWNDTYWGVDLKTGKGSNILGQLLMKQRDYLKLESDFDHTENMVVELFEELR